MLPELHAVEVVLSGLALVVAGIIRGITGFGLLLVATPLLILFLPPKLVIAALVVPPIPTHLTILYRDGVHLRVFRERCLLFSIAIVGTATGVVGLAVFSTSLLSVIVAAYIFGYLVLSRFRDAAEKYADRRDVGLLSGALAGLLGGSTGLAGPPIVTYLHARNLRRATFTSVLALFFITVTFVRIPAMIAADLFGVPELLLGLGLVVPAVLGTYVGSYARAYLPERLFTSAVDLLLLIVAIQLAVSGLGISPF